MSSKDKGGEDEHLIAIFDKDFALLCRDPILYSIVLTRPSEGGIGVSVGFGVGDDDDDTSRGSPCCDHLALAISYHLAYPDVTPTLCLVVHDNVRGATSGHPPCPLHPVQERAVLNTGYGAIARTG